MQLFALPKSQTTARTGAHLTCPLLPPVAVQINAVGPIRVVKSLLPLLEAGSSKVTLLNQFFWIRCPYLAH
jgi:hypothetical protein